MKTTLCGNEYPLENTGWQERSSPAVFGGRRATAELKASVLGVTALAIAILCTRLTWPLFERAPLLLVFCAILASSHLLTETAGLVVILVAVFGAAQVVPPGGPAIVDGSIITFLAASVFFNRLIVRRNQALAALEVSEEHLTQQIMALGRLEAAEDRVVDVNAIIGGVGDALIRLVGDQIELSCVLEPQLRPVHADPNQVEQVLMNLSVNARDAMPRGGRLVLETTNVTVGSESYVRLVVRDTGSGMNDYVRSQLFKPFFTTKSQDAGTGLGLFTVDNIVKRMGGVIHVESAPNDGTTFMIDLPSLEPYLQPVA